MRDRHAGSAQATGADDTAEPGTHNSHDPGPLRQDVPGIGGCALRPGLSWVDGVVSAAGGQNQDPRIVSGGGQRASRTGRPDGGSVGAACGRGVDGGPDFSKDVPVDGYRWWYVDALSDDGECGLTVIAFIGSVFSPYYAWARKRGPSNPLDYCAINVVLYGRGGKRWAMTERDQYAVSRDASSLTVGPSAVAWNGTELVIDLDEITVPFPRRVRGRIRVMPRALTRTFVPLDALGLHAWWPISPMCDIEADFQQPGRRWRGTGYLDSNWGGAPLESAFKNWHWSRAAVPDGAVILYDVVRRDADTADLSVALRFDRTGIATPFEPPPTRKISPSAWHIDRDTRCDEGKHPHQMESLEDTPFYARSVVQTHLLGERVTSVHESLSLERFCNPVVKMMLPFKMPRRAG